MRKLPVSSDLLAMISSPAAGNKASQPHEKIDELAKVARRAHTHEHGGHYSNLMRKLPVRQHTVISGQVDDAMTEDTQRTRAQAKHTVFQ
jgi:hypothetical protein